MFSKLTFIVTVLAAFMLASCGGTQMATAPVTPAGNSGATAAKPLPNVFAEFNGTPSRGASDLTTIPGSDALDSAGGTVVDTTMVLDSTGSASNMAWALYQVQGLAGRRASSLSIELSLPASDTPYSVGVSNFSDGVWDFLQPVAGETSFHYDLTADQARLVSQLGNLYFVVVVDSGNSATILSASVESQIEGPQHDTLPLRAQRPNVSEGLPDRIEVSWAAVDGADSYELWRELDSEGAQWELIATQAELSYIDTNVQLSVEYKYKVRALNAMGAGGFSEKRSGWAGAAPAGHNEMEDEDMENKAAIEAIGATSFTAGGIEYQVDSNTLFTDGSGNPITFADMTVGMQVEVQADSNGEQWIARSVKVESENEGGGGSGGGGGSEQRFEGVLQSIDASGLTINDTAIAFDSATEFRDLNGNPADWTIFTSGDTIKVRAVADADGKLTATQVELEAEVQG